MKQTRRMRIGSPWLRAYYRNLRDFIYPPFCAICNAPVPDGDSWFCVQCANKLEQNRLDRMPCPRCSHDLHRDSCTCSIVWEHDFDAAFSFFNFDEAVQDIIHHIKYKGKKTLAQDIGMRYASFIPQSFLSCMHGIIAVPLHFMRRLKRGYNQAESFAQGLHSGLGQPFPLWSNILLRRKNTKTQTKLNREERHRNLSDAFMVNPRTAGAIQGKGVMLVDDVITTGATADCCARKLLDAGATVVRVISLARA